MKSCSVVGSAAAAVGAGVEIVASVEIEPCAGEVVAAGEPVPFGRIGSAAAAAAGVGVVPSAFARLAVKIRGAVVPAAAADAVELRAGRVVEAAGASAVAAAAVGVAPA